ncbi:MULTISPECIES: DUF6880 family protein [unclassified Methylobacterium]|uniref:DUF6880 family protein n=1 Tax=unclassified Methylobacterium TaxID=2615210 RepID=UPI00039D199C|nr:MULTISPECIES: DUF6880 family protein [Methylobacterium]WFT81247.1 hypothetical protein QA634_04935 [Methylobacterium nodulans]
MASKKTVSVANLTALGAERLAKILIELADENAQVKRRLRLEFAAEARETASLPRLASTSLHQCC